MSRQFHQRIPQSRSCSAVLLPTAHALLIILILELYSFIVNIILNFINSNINNVSIIDLH